MTGRSTFDRPRFTQDIDALVIHPTSDGRVLLVRHATSEIYGRYPRRPAVRDIGSRKQLALRCAWRPVGEIARVNPLT
jgi:hypothetical protein